ncbi:TetR/AcrR family transcriptional regulator [Ruegeria sp.]|uniref:TetR/AcrR family transcriptional regulator n=1 Tax=Ruegeria sp. TaxID=1879320 RepID=UPI003B5A110B
MTKPTSTKENLLNAARELFWTRGYSNVSVRDITKEAGVDAALVSRYFGGKRGLFDATLAEIPPWTALTAESDEVLRAATDSFAQPYDPKTDQANPFTMLLANIIDPEVGDDIRAMVQNGMATPLADKLDGELQAERAALLLAVLFGAAMMRKNFQLKGIAEKTPDEIAAQIMHLGQAALRFKG